ncbi:hypothetical protein ACF3NF_04040 [Anaerococcus martiniensis]|uniref:hypothetical protein n=1 Tax=Anaerococcus sp. WGS1579 TaxID=3366809 RepID=UPI00372D1184
MKFRKMKSTMLAALMFTSFTACANNENPADTNSPENQAQQQAESTEEDTQNTDQNPEEITDNEESSDENTEINIPEAVNLTDDGSYTTSLIPGREGEREADGSWANVYDMEIQGDNLIVKGSLDYAEPMRSEEGTIPIDNQISVFKVNDNSNFFSRIGREDISEHSPEDFIKYYNENKDQQEALFIEVREGILYELMMVSGEQN